MKLGKYKRHYLTKTPSLIHKCSVSFDCLTISRYLRKLTRNSSETKEWSRDMFKRDMLSTTYLYFSCQDLPKWFKESACFWINSSNWFFTWKSKNFDNLGYLRWKLMTSTDSLFVYTLFTYKDLFLETILYNQSCTKPLT